jgi:hypothetical protein
MAQGTLGIPARVGVVTPLRWWFKSQPQANPIPTPPPPPGAPGPSDEPPAVKPTEPAPAPGPKVEQNNRGGGTIATREALAAQAGAGNVDNIGDFAKAALSSPLGGPIGAAAFMGRLALSGLRQVGSSPLSIGGAPGADITNSNQAPGAVKAMENAALAGAPAAAVQQMGRDALQKLRDQQKKPAPPGRVQSKGGPSNDAGARVGGFFGGRLGAGLGG